MISSVIKKQVQHSTSSLSDMQRGSDGQGDSGPDKNQKKNHEMQNVYLVDPAILANAPSKLSAKLTTLLNNTEASDSKGSPNNKASLRTF